MTTPTQVTEGDRELASGFFSDICDIENLAAHISNYRQKIVAEKEAEMQSYQHKSEIEQDFIGRLFEKLDAKGYDTSDCDGDDAPETILADWIHGLVLNAPNAAEEHIAQLNQQLTAMREALLAAEKALREAHEDELFESVHMARGTCIICEALTIIHAALNTEKGTT